MRVEKLKRFIDRDYPEFIDVVRDEQYRCVKFFEDEMKTRYYINTLEHYGSTSGKLSKHVLRMYAHRTISEHTDYVRFKLLL